MSQIRLIVLSVILGYLASWLPLYWYSLFLPLYPPSPLLPPSVPPPSLPPLALYLPFLFLSIPPSLLTSFPPPQVHDLFTHSWFCCPFTTFCWNWSCNSIRVDSYCWSQWHFNWTYLYKIMGLWICTSLFWLHVVLRVRVNSKCVGFLVP